MAEPSRLASALEYLGGLDAAVAPKLRAVSDAIDPVNVARRAGLNLPTGAQATEAAHFVGPGADIEGMVNDARDGNAAFGRGDLLGALGGYGSAAMAIPMMALPGTVAGVKKGVGAVADALPMDNASRMARMGQQGYIPDLYHGTAADVQRFDKSMFGSSTKAAGANKAAWLVDDPRTATGYAEHAAGKPVRDALEKSETYERLAHKTGDNHWWDKQDEAVRMAEEIEASGLSGQNVMPLAARGNLMSHDFSGAEYTDVAKDVARLLKEAQAGGYDGLKLLNLADDVASNGRPATHYAIFDPKNIRSKFAAFDPSKIDSANLLASALTAGVFGAGVAGSTNKEPE